MGLKADISALLCIPVTLIIKEGSALLGTQFIFPSLVILGLSLQRPL